MAFLVYGSLASRIRVPKLLLFAHADKLIHFLMYFIFAALALWSLDPRSQFSQRYPKWKYVLVLLMAFTWGTVMELLQRFLASGRQFSLLDMLANSLGAVLSILMYNTLFVKNKAMSA